MSTGVNRVLLLGYLGADPELRFTQAGQAVLNMRLATTESYVDKDKNVQERTEWHSVVVWARRGEGLAKVVGKGSRLYVEGSLRTSSYDDRDGNKRYKVEIVATNVVLCGGSGAGENAGGGSAASPPAAGGSHHGGGPATAGDFVVGFGNDKGKKISAVADLAWLRGKLEGDIADPEKAKYHSKARLQLASIDAELARRSGGGRADGGSGERPMSHPRRATTPASPPQDDPYAGGGYGTGSDDDLPF